MRYVLGTLLLLPHSQQPLLLLSQATPAGQLRPVTAPPGDQRNDGYNTEAEETGDGESPSTVRLVAGQPDRSVDRLSQRCVLS